MIQNQNFLNSCPTKDRIEGWDMVKPLYWRQWWARVRTTPVAPSQGWRGRRPIGVSGSLILSKTLMELTFNPCGKFRWSLEGPVSQIHSPHLHAGVPGIFSYLLRTVQMLKREWGAESNRKLPHLFIPSKTTTLVPEFAVEDLPLNRTAILVDAFAVKDLSLGRTIMMMMCGKIWNEICGAKNGRNPRKLPRLRFVHHETRSEWLCWDSSGERRVTNRLRHGAASIIIFVNFLGIFPYTFTGPSNITITLSLTSSWVINLYWIWSNYYN